MRNKTVDPQHADEMYLWKRVIPNEGESLRDIEGVVNIWIQTALSVWGCIIVFSAFFGNCLVWYRSLFSMLFSMLIISVKEFDSYTCRSRFALRLRLPVRLVRDLRLNFCLAFFCAGQLLFGLNCSFFFRFKCGFLQPLIKN